MKGANASKPQLPEGVIWPRFEDGELVKFGDMAKVREDIGEVIEIRFHTGKCSEVTIAFEDESTATHYMVVDGPRIKRPEPDTAESILSEMVSAIESEDCVDLDPYIERYRKLKGGESHE